MFRNTLYLEFVKLKNIVQNCDECVVAGQNVLLGPTIH